MKISFRSTFAIVAVTAIGIEAYRAYESWPASNISKEELLLVENVEALSQSDTGSKTKMVAL